MAATTMSQRSPVAACRWWARTCAYTCASQKVSRVLRVSASTCPGGRCLPLAAITAAAAIEP
jgi:hypothetical protein